MPAAAGGGDAPPPVRYALAAWSTEQSGDVLSITQDLDGYLWLGTPEGPVRFDGGFLFGITELDPDWGFTVGFTWVFKAFEVK